MGNCLERPRPARGGGGGAHCARKSAVWVEGREEARKAEPAAPAAAAAASATTTEVKVRITRKQLEELLRRVEDGKRGGGGGVPVREVISELLSVASTSSNFRHGEEAQWRPSLQSIPE